MNVTIVGGGGYVGFTTAVCLAYKGHKVFCVDTDLKKVNQINQGLPVFYEPELEKILKKVTSEKRLTATSDYMTPNFRIVDNIPLCGYALWRGWQN